MKEKINQKGFAKIIIPITIIGLLVIGTGSYFGYKWFGNYQDQQIAKQKQAEEKQNQENSEIEKLKKEIENLKEKPPQVIIKTIPEEQNKNDLPSIIKQWQLIIAYIECDFYYRNDNGVWGDKYSTQGGSGILERKRFYNQTRNEYTGDINVLTNKHVVLYEGIYAPKNCTVQLPGHEPIFIDNFLSSQRYVHHSVTYDCAIIEIVDPPSYIENLTYSFNSCRSQPSIGDEIAILGYPGIGSQTGITATEGIISGFDGDYYITSAKVEHGNSGGAAILIKDNCYLGIPTFVRVGEIESLARILKADVCF